MALEAVGSAGDKLVPVGDGSFDAPLLPEMVDCVIAPENGGRRKDDGCYQQDVVGAFTLRPGKGREKESNGLKEDSELCNGSRLHAGIGRRLGAALSSKFPCVDDEETHERDKTGDYG